VIRDSFFDLFLVMFYILVIF